MPTPPAKLPGVDVPTLILALACGLSLAAAALALTVAGLLHPGVASACVTVALIVMRRGASGARPGVDDDRHDQ